MTTRPTLTELEPLLNAAARTAASKAGRVAKPLCKYEYRLGAFDHGGFTTTCLRTAEFAAAWLNNRKHGYTNYGKPLPVRIYGQTGNYQIRVYEFSN